MTEINNEMDFEQAYDALKETVAAMESPNNTIEENLALYERACRLTAYCQRRLSDARDRITDINERIRELNASGAPIFEE